MICKVSSKHAKPKRHWLLTCRAHTVVLVIQDSTEVDDARRYHFECRVEASRRCSSAVCHLLQRRRLCLAP